MQEGSSKTNQIRNIHAGFELVQDLLRARFGVTKNLLHSAHDTYTLVADEYNSRDEQRAACEGGVWISRNSCLWEQRWGPQLQRRAAAHRLLA